MKYLVVIVAVVALGWFGFNRYLATSRAAAENRLAASAVTPSEKPMPPPKAEPSSADTRPAPAATPLRDAQVTFGPLTAPAPNPNAPIKIDLARALGPNNHYVDDVVGLSVSLPERWVVRDAIRWGEGHRQNTVFMRPEVASSASPSMYYKPYTAEEAMARGNSGAEALLRDQAQKKEASRVAGTADYKNVPESFAFFDVNGSPAMTYFATFTRGDQVMTEHFIRVLGPRGYVMFFTSGKFEDVKAIMPQLQQAASTVKGP